MAEDIIRRGLLLRAAAEVLRDVGGPVPAGEAVKRVGERVQLTDYELVKVESGSHRYASFVHWYSTALAAAGWIDKTKAGWVLTAAGLSALDRYPGDAFYDEASRLYEVQYKQKKAKVAFLSDPRGSTVVDALTAVPTGWWTSLDDLAELSGLDADAVRDFLAGAGDVPSRHRVLSLTDAPLATSRAQLEGEGVEFDAAGRPAADQRATAEDLRDVIGWQTAGTRAWLVRGSAVSGVNVVPLWLAEGFVSIAAAHLTPVTAGTPLDDLQKIIESHYAHLSYHQRKAKLAELNAFLNRMQPGDAVLTTAYGQLHFGRLAGEAAFGPTGDTRTTIRRPVTWQVGSVDFPLLPEVLQAKLKSSAAVVDLTENAELIEQLFGSGPVVIEERPVLREAVLPDLDEAAIDRLLVGPDWLNEFVDLLRTRRQVILHGPPGTGKTFLALEVAERLTDPANVTLVQFHPAYSYEDFFEGYRPAAVDDSGRVGFALTPGPFRKIVDAAKENPGAAFVLIIDEINRANLAKVFGELYFLLEYRDRSIDLMYASGDEGRDFTLPKNVYVIGTMNTADRSIALVDAAMRRRFAFLSLHPDDAHLHGVLREWLRRAELSTVAADLLAALNDRIPDRDFKIGPSYLMRTEAGTDAGLDRIWRTSILPLLEELHYGETGVVVSRRYGLAALRAALPNRPLEGAASAGGTGDTDLGA